MYVWNNGGCYISRVRYLRVGSVASSLCGCRYTINHAIGLSVLGG